MTQVQRGGAFAVLDLMQIGVVLTDAAGLILFANQAADALLQAGDGLTVKAGHLAAMRDSASAQLQRLISEAARAGRDRAPAYLMLPRTVERPLSAAVVPIRTNEPSSLEDQPSVALFIADPERAMRPSAKALQNLYGLTTAEARALVALAEGKSIAAIAADNGISVWTVRTQLRHAMRKTKTRRHNELIAIVLRSIVTTVAW